jgi:hypothetical protein
MSKEITQQNNSMQLPSEVLSSLVLNVDVSQLDHKQKMQYYIELCNRVGIDPSTQPFKLLKLNGKQVFYADKGATQQLSQKHNISHEIVKREQVKDVYVVTVRAKLADGRYTDEDGAVTIGNSTGDNLANGLMKATTKAKRRAVLALLGLGMMDESEIDTIPNAVKEEMPKAEVPSVQDAVVVHVTTEETVAGFDGGKKKRSDWYYELRDGIMAATSMESLKHVETAIVAHKDVLAKDELADLRTAYKKQNNKLVTENK